MTSVRHFRNDFETQRELLTAMGEPPCLKSVLGGEVGKRLRELIREICKTYDVEILKGHIPPDHVHLLLSVPPTMSPSRVMNAIKCKSSKAQIDFCGTFVR